MSDNFKGTIGHPTLNFWTGFSNVISSASYRGTAPPIGIFAFYTGWSGAIAPAVTRGLSGMLAAKHVRRRIHHGR